MTEQAREQEPDTGPSDGPGSFLLGAACPIGLAIFFFLVLARHVDSKFVGIFLMFIGLSQLIYVLPLIIYCHRKRRRRLLQGLIIGASIVFLLNASCFGLLMTTSW